MCPLLWVNMQEMQRQELMCLLTSPCNIASWLPSPSVAQVVLKDFSAILEHLKI